MVTATLGRAETSTSGGGGGPFTETKAGYMTTECFLAVVAILAILIATYVDEGRPRC